MNSKVNRDESPPKRRRFLSLASTLAGVGLAAGYGAFATIATRFLFPARPDPKRWLFATEVNRLKVGESMVYRTPTGEPVTIARQTSGSSESDFIALSSTCPHLGCQVHWEAHHNRFFCPCHNGVFDPTGRATAGPPADAGQELVRFPLKTDGGLLYIQAPTMKLARGDGPGSGHDPCLASQAPKAPPDGTPA